MRRRARHAAFSASIALAISLLAPSGAWAQAAAEVVVSNGQSISRDYRSWSLFLVCNPEWLAGGEAAQNNMRELYRAFGSFGRIIGSDNLAVWFRKPTTGSEPSAADAYDADEAGNYCGVYGLSANDSPHIVVTTAYPTKNGRPGNYYAISLNRLDNTNRLRLLGSISDRIRMSDFRTAQLDSDRYWRGWIQVLQDSAQVLGQLLPALKFTVDARAVKLEFDGSRISPGP